jgi:hypothetical protein
MSAGGRSAVAHSLGLASQSVAGLQPCGAWLGGHAQVRGGPCLLLLAVKHGVKVMG